DLCPPEKTKVVILGQDPYHGPGQAQGLCFSVPQGVSHPPSLINIFRELEKDLQIPYPERGDLTAWAQQGVLLLNAILTVEAHRAGSHQGKGWEKFTDRVIEILSERYEGIVFLLWGGFAKQKLKLIDEKKHCVLTSGHPSPLSANRGYWFGNGHFSMANAYLSSIGKTPIDWRL
ncbi:MAG: uracil-DNA glycosylase, partial [Flavobacteriia bacterium]|nr:uracil-DNA glycosylase [Flavobacteriia bacterium]